MIESPWYRSWRNEHSASRRITDEIDRYARVLLVMILAMGMFIFGWQLGLHEGGKGAYQKAEAAIWAKHYDSYAKVQWLIDEADLKAMWVKR